MLSPQELEELPLEGICFHCQKPVFRVDDSIDPWRHYPPEGSNRSPIPHIYCRFYDAHVELPGTPTADAEFSQVQMTEVGSRG